MVTIITTVRELGQSWLKEIVIYYLEEIGYGGKMRFPLLKSEFS